jgi:hypothetical protein
MHVNAHINTETGKKKTVWYSGTDALKRGEGLCYNTDFGTAADSEPSRGSRVERPTVSNNKAFAGVAVRDHAASSTGQFVEIWEPGSRCVPVALAVDTVIDTGILSFTTAGRCNIAADDGLGTDAGRFYTGKFRGRGSAIPRQTVTALIESDMVGAWSLGTDGVTLTVTATAGLAAGDTVVLLGGEDDGTGTVIPGKYSISSVTNSTVLVLATSAVDVTPGGALTCTGYAYTGNPVALCDLLDGDEECSGLEFLNAPNAGSAAMPHMAGGVTYVCGGLTLAADVDAALAQGTEFGERKAFHCLGTMTTSDFTIVPATAGLSLDGAAALAAVNGFDAAGDIWIGVFQGALWHSKDVAGGAVESAV